MAAALRLHSGAVCRVADVGLARYLLYFVLYMMSVEFFVYWQHRILHMGVGYRCEKPQASFLRCVVAMHLEKGK